MQLQHAPGQLPATHTVIPWLGLSGSRAGVLLNTYASSSRNAPTIKLSCILYSEAVSQDLPNIHAKEHTAMSLGACKHMLLLDVEPNIHISVQPAQLTCKGDGLAYTVRSIGEGTACWADATAVCMQALPTMIALWVQLR